ncbi:hypothetical protein D3C76_433040 [compost metagenome]
MKDRSHDEVMAEHLRADPTYAAELLAEVCREGDLAELAILLRQISEAFRQGSVGIAFTAGNDHE